MKNPRQKSSTIHSSFDPIIYIWTEVEATLERIFDCHRKSMLRWQPVVLCNYDPPPLFPPRPRGQLDMHDATAIVKISHTNSTAVYAYERTNEEHCGEFAG